MSVKLFSFRGFRKVSSAVQITRGDEMWVFLSFSIPRGFRRICLTHMIKQSSFLIAKKNISAGWGGCRSIKVSIMKMKTTNFCNGVLSIVSKIGNFFCFEKHGSSINPIADTALEIPLYFYFIFQVSLCVRQNCSYHRSGSSS